METISSLLISLAMWINPSATDTADIWVEDTKNICIYPHSDISTQKHCLDSQEAWRLINSYREETGEIMSFSCERSLSNTDLKDMSNGIQRFLINTGRDFESVCKYQGLVADADCDERNLKEWAQPTVWIDYRKNHRVCVKNIYSKDTPAYKTFGQNLCFDLYDIGER